MSAKNILQEYCQKHRLDLPSYHTQRISDQYSAPLFKSTVRFMNREHSGTSGTRISAEQKVAKLAWDQFSQEQTCAPRCSTSRDICDLDPAIIQCGGTSTVSRQQKYASIKDIPNNLFDVVYLIDGDNCDVTSEEIFANQRSLFIYFIAKNCTKPHPMAHQTKFSNCCVFISEIIARDAADHLLSFLLGQMTILWSSKKYIIATNYHFGEVLSRIVPNCQVVCEI